MNQSSMVFFGAGVLVGAGITGLVAAGLMGRLRRVTADLLDKAQTERSKEFEQILGRMKESFTAISYEALRNNLQQFMNIAGETLKNQTVLNEQTLESKKQLIDQTLAQIGKEIAKVNEVITQYERDRQLKFGELSQQLQMTAEQTAKLRDTAEHLRAVLTNTRVRGQWGERMAEDVLRMVGFVEGVNYTKQEGLSSGNRPDYTFYLPKARKVHMDVKFPLDNYLQYLQAERPDMKETYKQQFLKDVRTRIKEVTTRDYINPEENTLDYVLVFIPNEQIYGFIHESDGTLMDMALQHRVVLCSPLTLYAFLSVIRQAVDNFHLEQATSRILSLLGSFYKQWDAFCSAMDRMGKRLADAQKEYASLVSTRRHALERPLQMIDSLRRERNLDVEIPSGDNPDAEADNGQI